MAVEIQDNTEQILTMMERAQIAALTECGLRAEEYAKNACPVDTGLLRNSITYALDGESVANQRYKANKGSETGSYSGQAPKEGGDDTRSVYVGTNVKYAIYVENGTGGDRNKGPRPFIKTAVTGHVEEYRNIIRKYLDAYN